MKKYAVIVAGGSGSRMGTALPKQFLLLKGKPVIWHSINAFLSAFNDIHIILVLPELHIEKGQTIAEMFATTVNLRITKGGDTRFQSVKNGLALTENNAVIFVHDAVRCLVSADLIKRCYQSTIENGNAVPVVIPQDSLRMETADGNHTIDRSTIRVIQTPQTFLGEVIISAFEQAYEESFTDEATVVEKYGVKINLVEGHSNNFKITRPIDLAVAEQLL